MDFLLLSWELLTRLTTCRAACMHSKPQLDADAVRNETGKIWRIELIDNEAKKMDLTLLNQPE